MGPSDGRIRRGLSTEKARAKSVDKQLRSTTAIAPTDSRREGPHSPSAAEDLDNDMMS
jgi:hypothetical protein